MRHFHTQMPRFFLFRQIVISWSPATCTRCLSTTSCMHGTVGLDDLLLFFFFIASHPVALPRPTECVCRQDLMS